MTDKELKKYTVDFINNETGSNRSNINSVMGKMLIKYAEVFQNRIKELERINADGLSELNHINGDLIIENEKLRKENAELKKKLNVFSNESANACFAHNEKSKQLTKAKEHIQTLISCLIDWVQEGDKDYCHIADAEQFLKENE